MEFRLLGDLEVVEGGRRLPLGGRKQRALLAALLLDANRVVHADVLVEMLWGDQASEKARANLHSLVSRLRRTLGADRIERHAGGYLLRVAEAEVDVFRFERLRAEARLLPPAAASERLRLALDLWRGPALADFSYDSWAAGDIQRIDELRAAAVEERIDADLEAGRHAELVAELQSLVAEHPLREGYRRQLIVALYRSGRQAEALEAYQAARKMLDDELGLEPSPALRALEAAVLRQDPSLAAPAAAPARRVAPAMPVARGKRGLGLMAASAALAFAAAAGAVLGLDREEPRRSQAAAASERPNARTTSTPIVTPRPAAMRPPRQTVVVRTIVRTNPRAAPAAEASPPRKTRRPPKSTPAPAEPAQAPPPPAAPPPAAPPKAPLPPRRPPPPPAAFRQTDEFADGVPGGFWRAKTYGTGVSVVEQNGRLELAIAPEAQGEWFGAAYESRCRFGGDFELTIDYELLDWPAANGVGVQVTAWFGADGLTLARQSHSWGEQYNSWTRNGSSAETSDVRGTLRLRRKNGYVYSYYRDGGAWSVLRVFPSDDTAEIRLTAGTTSEFFARTAVRAAFDNFRLTAGRRWC